ncbi:MAG: hypothetical protein L0322_20930 [Chloroflexi bacterium]|nr:hypothetical protein [Chloroflexota bacterium]MCI0575082.1 hypothetical protein [Chloroflexota bacterium]MCI0643672.1 hypothetical protein [Chloroflexota bacterium]
MPTAQVELELPAPLKERYDELVAKLRAETLTPKEHEELLQLTDQVEQFEAQRVKHLIELASLRHVSLEQLMTDLGIHPPDVYAG